MQKSIGASYQVDLRVVNDPAQGGYDATVGDVFTEAIHNEEMRNQSFLITVTADFLEKQPEVLFESSSLHEICHIMNDDLPGYHRNGANIEAAEERCVLQAVGESRYQQYLQVYAQYQHWDRASYEKILQKVKSIVLLPAPTERDDADRLAEDFFRRHADCKEHLLAYDGELHDLTLYSINNRVWHDSSKTEAVIKAGKPLIFLHNHPPEAGRAAMFPSYDDFAVAALLLLSAHKEHPNLSVEFRVMLVGAETSVVSYGFQRPVLDEIQRLAQHNRQVVATLADPIFIPPPDSDFAYQLAQEVFNEYLLHACPVDLSRKKPEACRTHPEYFLWPNDKFFVHFRPN